MKKVFKPLAILLCTVMVFQVVQIGALAAAWPTTAVTIDQGERAPVSPDNVLAKEIDAQAAPESPIEEELVSLRGESVKHFRKADGTFLAITYPEPVHYSENGQWKDVDASLGLELDAGGNEVFAAWGMPNPVSLPASFDGGQRITLEAGDYIIGFGVSSLNENVNFEAPAQLLEADQTATQTPVLSSFAASGERTASPQLNDALTANEKIREQNDEIIAVETQASAAIYADVFEGVDLEYIITPNKIKESIILKQPNDTTRIADPVQDDAAVHAEETATPVESETEPTVSIEPGVEKIVPAAYRYTFDMDFGGLIPVAQADGSYLLTDPQDETRVVAVLEAPYMMDAAGQRSENVTMTLVAQEGFYLLSVEADAQWVNAEDRAWPVAIDPTVTVLGSGMQFKYVGSNSMVGMVAACEVNGQTAPGPFYGRAYVLASLPTLPQNSLITGAAYTVQGHTGDDQVHELYPGTGVYGRLFPSENTEPIYCIYAGNSYNPTLPDYWSQQSYFGTTPNSFRDDLALDYVTSPTEPGETFVCSWDVTKQIWEEENTNSLLFMISKWDETKEGAITLDGPGALAISYINNIGLEDYWSYETFDLGRSGTVYVNRYTQRLTYVHPDLTLNGNRMPLNLSHNLTDLRPYAPDVFSTIGDGAGGSRFAQPFAMNIMEYIVTSGSLYHLIDGDGTTHYFTEGTQTDEYVSENDPNLVLTRLSATSFKLEDARDNIKYYGYDDGAGFSTTGGTFQLYKMEDANGNVTTIEAGGEEAAHDYSGLIRSVTDAVGREILFDYTFDENGQPLYLSSITDPSGRETTFAYLEDSIEIGYADGAQTVIEISGDVCAGTGANLYSAMRINRIEAADGSEIMFTYSSDPQRIRTVECRDAANNLTQKLGFRGGDFAICDVYDLSDPDVEPFSEASLLYQYAFDRAGRLACARDAEFNARHTQYNSEGSLNNKVSRASAEQSMAQNLARNHSFEIDTGDWVLETSLASPGTAAATDAQAYVGAYAMRVGNASPTGVTSVTQTYVNNQYSAVQAGNSYTLSAYVALPAAIAAGEAGVRLTLRAENNSGGFVEGVSEWITQKQGWTRYDATIFIPAIWTDTITLKAFLTVEGAEGVAYFDAVQLESGDCVNDYNLLENGIFEYIEDGAPTAWTPSETGTQQVMSLADETITANMLALFGDAAQANRVAQTVTVNAKAGQNLVFSVYGGGSGGASEGLYGVLVDAGAGGSAYVPFDGNQRFGLQVAGGSLRLTQDCQTVTLALVFDCNVGMVGFRGAALYVGNFGESFAYNESGLPTAIRNDLGNSVSIEYDDMNNPALIQQKFNGMVTDEAEVVYDDHHNITRSVINGIETNYYYDGTQDGSTTCGAVTETTVESEDGLFTAEAMAYTDDYNYLAEYTDAQGETSAYEYDENSGLLLSATDARGNTLTHTYDAATGKLLSTTGYADATTPVTTSYSYAANVGRGMLAGITNGNTSYTFDYDHTGRFVETNIGDSLFNSSEYDQEHRLTQYAIGTGEARGITRDEKGRVVSETFAETGEALEFVDPTYRYAYNRKDQMTRFYDETSDTLWRYEYDLAGRRSLITGSDGVQAKMGYNDKANKLNRLTVRHNGDTITDTAYLYADDGRPLGAELYGEEGDGETADAFADVSYAYDGLNRFASQDVTVNGVVFRTSVGYAEGADGSASDQIATYKTEKIDGGTTTALSNCSYTYDENGNIISSYDSKAYPANRSYEYDGLNRMTYDSSFGMTYSYGADGNLSYGSHTYGNADWPNQLTQFDVEALTYDAAGNLLSFASETFAWSHGRMTNRNGYDYTYDVDGNPTRISQNGGASYEYTWVEGKLTKLTHSTHALYFSYDANDMPIGFRYNDEFYIYVRDLQGNILSVINTANGNVSAYYGYADSFGLMGSYASDWAGSLNPFTYRGCFTAPEGSMYSNLFLVDGRWYSDNLQRFLSPDQRVISGDDALTGTNLYAFAQHNPMGFNNNPVGRGVFDAGLVGDVRRNILPASDKNVGVAPVVDQATLERSTREWEQAKAEAEAEAAEKARVTASVTVVVAQAGLDGVGTKRYLGFFDWVAAMLIAILKLFGIGGSTQTITLTITDPKSLHRRVFINHPTNSTRATTYTVDPTDKTVVWQSIDPNIATVNEATGAITGVSEGITSVVAKIDGKEKARIRVCSITWLTPSKKGFMEKATSLQLDPEQKGYSEIETDVSVKANDTVYVAGTLGNYYFLYKSTDSSKVRFAKKDDVYFYTQAQERTANSDMKTAAIALLGQPDYNDEDAWKKLSKSTQLARLRNLLGSLKTLMKLPNDITLQFVDDLDSSGDYNPNTRTINIKTDRRSAYPNVLRYVLHECRHAYQYDSIQDPMKHVTTKETIKRWNNNWNNYVDGEFGEAAHMQQPLEWDAYFFDGRITKTQYNPVYSANWP